MGLTQIFTPGCFAQSKFHCRNWMPHCRDNRRACSPSDVSVDSANVAVRHCTVRSFCFADELFCPIISMRGGASVAIQCCVKDLFERWLQKKSYSTRESRPGASGCSSSPTSCLVLCLNWCVATYQQRTGRFLLNAKKWSQPSGMFGRDCVAAHVQQEFHLSPQTDPEKVAVLLLGFIFCLLSCPGNPCFTNPLFSNIRNCLRHTQTGCCLIWPTGSWIC